MSAVLLVLIHAYRGLGMSGFGFKAFRLQGLVSVGPRLQTQASSSNAGA